MSKVALITGASSGIGRELAQIHAERGGDLVVRCAYYCSGSCHCPRLTSLRTPYPKSVSSATPMLFAARRYARIVTKCITGMALMGAIAGCQGGDDPMKVEKKSWDAFSAAAKDEHVMSGKNCFVFVFAEMNPESFLAIRDLDRKKLAPLCNDGEYATLLLKYNDWNDPDIRAIWLEVGHTKMPFIVLYSQDRPPIAFDPFTLKPLTEHSEL